MAGTPIAAPTTNASVLAASTIAAQKAAASIGGTYEDNKGGTGGFTAGAETPTTAAAAYKNAGGSVPLITTSSTSRANFSSNVTNLNKALNSTTAGNSNPSVVDYLAKSGMPSDFSSRSALATKYGIQNYTGSADQNTQLLGKIQSDTNSSSPSDGTPETTPTATDTTTSPPVGSTTNADGSTTNPDGTTKNIDGSTTDPNDPTSGLPPAIASGYKATLSQQDVNIQQAQSTLDAARKTLTNDPAAVAAADAISTQYGTLIAAMQAKNNIILGSYKENAARNGSLQYGNDMETSFMSNEMNLASTRLSDLVTKEQELTLRSNTAYQNSDVKAFNDAQTALDKATTDKSDTLGKLLTATNAQVKTVQAQQRITDAETKQKLTDDVTASKAAAAGMAQAISQSGITDPAQISSYVQEMATKLGISNPDILSSELATAQQTATKANLSNENVASEITKRGSTSATSGKPAVDGTLSYTKDDINDGKAKLKDGFNGYAPAGTDGYSDPGLYTAMMNQWTKQGGTISGFAKAYPPKTYINPDSYSGLPTSIAPKKAAASTIATPK